MTPTLHQMKEARAALSQEAALERSPARRDILDAAVLALEHDILRTTLYNECMNGVSWSNNTGERPFCSRCGVQHR